MAQRDGQEAAVVVLVERDGMCLEPVRAGVSLVGLREMSGLHAVAVAATYARSVAGPATWPSCPAARAFVAGVAW